jgi:SAM-dependent methyltransferase
LLPQYVNDRPYVASSFLSVAINRVFGSAQAGKCEKKPERVDQAWTWTVRLSVVPCRGGDVVLRKLFEPLGYDVTAERCVLDDKLPEWGASAYYHVTPAGTNRLQDLLSHLYVLVPVLDDEKHYWIGEDEVEKLIRKGEGWLTTHPERERIVRRYLKHKRSLARAALSRLNEDDALDGEALDEEHARQEEAVEEPIRLHDLRIDAVARVVVECGAKKVIDLGCGEGRLVRELVKHKEIERIVGIDVSVRCLNNTVRRLGYNRSMERHRSRVDLIHGSLMYRDARQQAQLRRGLRGLKREGFSHIYRMESIEELDGAVIERTRLYNNLKHLTGPFDIIGDLHGCCGELETLLAQLGYCVINRCEGAALDDGPVYAHPDARKAIFMGDLGDRGPRVFDCFRIVFNMVRAGHGLCVPGNHDAKLLRKLSGRDVKVSHGLAMTLAEIDAFPEDVRSSFTSQLAEFLDSLISHYVLDGGRLVVAHAGLKEELQGRGSGKVRVRPVRRNDRRDGRFGLPVR